MAAVTICSDLWIRTCIFLSGPGAVFSIPNHTIGNNKCCLLLLMLWVSWHLLLSSKYLYNQCFLPCTSSYFQIKLYFAYNTPNLSCTSRSKLLSYILTKASNLLKHVWLDILCHLKRVQCTAQSLPLQNYLLWLQLF